MSNVKTGLWSGLGALVGGVVGAIAGKYAAEYRPHQYYAGRGLGRVTTGDAMVVGGAAGAVLGSVIAGAAAGEAQAPQLQPSK